MLTIIRKSIAASILIGLGVFALLALGTPLGAFLFAFGLMGVCALHADLFTGQIGFLFENKIKLRKIITILCSNLVAGYAFGALLHYANPEIVEAATVKASALAITPEFFIQGLLCGAVMYLAVKMFKEGNVWGILLGIPLFILTGMQHCIANVIVGGVALEYSPVFWGALGVNVLANTLGSIGLSHLLKEGKKKKINNRKRKIIK